MAEGEFAQVRQHMEAALEHLGEWLGDHELHTLLIDAASRQGDLEALDRYAPAAERSLENTRDPLAIGITHRAVGVAHRLRGELEQGQARQESALEKFEKLSARWQIGRTLFEIGLLAQAQSDDQAAAGQYRRALAEFEALGAAPDAALTRAALAEVSAS